MLFDTDDNRVVLKWTDGAGKEQLLDLLDVVEYQSAAFGVFLPAENHEGEVVILRLVGDDAQKVEQYVPVEDEDLEQAVFDLFQIKNMDAFDFGASAFQSNDLLL